MTYHEAFWVVTGTAAPVVAVALTVSASDPQGTFNRQIEDLARLARQAISSRGHSLYATTEAEHLVTRKYRIVKWFFYASVWLQAWILSTSLYSLADGKNSLRPIVIQLATWAGLLSIVVLQILATRYRVWSQTEWLDQLRKLADPNPGDQSPKAT